MRVFRNTRRFRRRNRGTVAIEYALILPVLLLFVLGITDTGRLLWTYVALHRSVAAAARCGAIDETACGTTTQIRTYAVAAAYGLPIAPGSYTVTSLA